VSARVQCSIYLPNRFAQQAKSQCACFGECASAVSWIRGAVPVIGTQNNSDPQCARAQTKTNVDCMAALASVPAQSTPIAAAVVVHTPTAAADVAARAAVEHNSVAVVADVSVAASEIESV